MIQFNETYTVIRNADNVCYAVNVTVDCYKGSLVYKSVEKRKSIEDSSLETLELPDFDKMTKIDSESLQYIIPLELKTDTLPQERPFYIGEGTEYDEFYQIWIQQIKDIGKVDIIKQRLLEKYSEFDGDTQ